MTNFSKVPTKKCYAYSPTNDKTDNFAGGLPYTNEDFKWPIDSEGTPLRFLFQAKLDDVPDVGLNLPKKGYLLFFNGADDLYGMDLDDVERVLDKKIIYLENATDKKIDPPERNEEDDDYSPLNDPDNRVYYKGKIFEMLPFPNSLDAPEDSYYGDFYDDEQEDFHEFYLGGYPHFVQDDFRDEEQKEQLLLLLGSESIDNVMWGDMGAAGYWIDKNKNESREYEKSFLYWDCG